MPTPIASSSGPADAMPYGPHTGDDRARMLAALGLDSVEPLFADIPASVRAHGLDLPGPEPELELAAPPGRPAGRAPRPRRAVAALLARSALPGPHGGPAGGVWGGARGAREAGPAHGVAGRQALQ